MLSARSSISAFDAFDVANGQPGPVLAAVSGGARNAATGASTSGSGTGTPLKSTVQLTLRERPLCSVARTSIVRVPVKPRALSS